uniref:Nucleolar protein 14 n=1 Tax=Parastrongyloides trichosuri TaxID=131310 RepID=A0A0N4ZYI0_PARTI
MGKNTKKTKPKQANPGGYRNYKPKNTSSTTSGIAKEKKINPFELKFNRNKHNVLGNKRSTVGAPGQSKKRAFEIRKQNLGEELNRLGKSNIIYDRRLGERDATLTEEQKAELRFKMQKEKFFKTKASKYNLETGVEEELTHKGSKLTNIQKFEKLEGDDDDGNLDPTLLADANFGGGEFESANFVPLGEKMKTRREILQEVITKSKQIKYEKQKEKEAWADKTKELDNMLNDLKKSGQLTGIIMRSDDNNVVREQSQNDKEYDDIYKKLSMDGGKMAAAEKGIKINEDRKRKIKFVVDDEGDSKKVKDEEFELRYDDDGNIVNLPKHEKYSISKIRCGSESESEDSDDCDESDDDIQDILGSDNEEQEVVDLINCQNEDVETDEDISDEEELCDEEEDDEEDEESDDTNGVPQSYEELMTELDNFDNNKTILEYIEELCEMYHPSKKQGNKEKLSRLFVFLLRYFDRTFKEVGNESMVSTLSLHIRSLYKLMKFDPDFASHCVRSLLKQKFKHRHEKNISGPITFDIIALFKLISSLFKTDTYLHLIATPATLVFMDILTNCHIKNSIDAAKSSFFISMFISSFDKNDFYSPEIIAHLKGLLMLSVNNDNNESFPTIQFPLIQPYRTSLYIGKNLKNSTIKPLSISKLFNNKYNEDDSEVILSVLMAILKNVQYFAVAYTDYSSSYCAIFQPLLDLLKRMPSNNYPQTLEKMLNDSIRLLNNEIKKNSSVIRLGKPQTEVKMLKMLEPAFEENFNPERKKIGKDIGSQNKQLKQKLRKETKGAIKELRKDAQFIAQRKRSEIQAINQERIEKTASIVKQLQGQEGEYKERSRGK